MNTWTRKLTVVLGVVVAFSTVLIYVIWVQQKPKIDIVLAPEDGPLVVLGENLYIQECAACHGSDLEGQENWQERLPNGRLPAPPHDASGHTWHHPDQLLFELTKYGSAAVVGGSYESDMPGYEGTLNDREIIAVLSFIKSRWPAQIRDRHDQINARYQKTYIHARQCVSRKLHVQHIQPGR